MFSAGVKPL